MKSQVLFSQCNLIYKTSDTDVKRPTPSHFVVSHEGTNLSRMQAKAKAEYRSRRYMKNTRKKNTKKECKKGRRIRQGSLIAKLDTGKGVYKDAP